VKRPTADLRDEQGTGWGHWRLSFPPDGSAVFAIDGPFDGAAAGTLRTRIEELTADERLGLVLDLSAAGELDAGQVGRLLRIVSYAQPDCPVVAIVRNPDAVRERIFVAHRRVRLWPVASRADARGVLHAVTPSRGRPQPGRAGIGARGRHLGEQRRHAVSRSLHWAQRSAAMGDYADALGWLELVEAVDGSLAPEWRARRRSWERGSHHTSE
jgi:hypothetical protein